MEKIIQMQQIAIVGFGEAGQAFAKGLAMPICAVDTRAQDERLQQIAWALGVSLFPQPQSALHNARAVFCLVTADQAMVAATSAAPYLPQGALWLDGNSCAPHTKRRAAKVINAAGACYVDMAIMAPIHPRLHQTPALLSGPYADEAALMLAHLGMSLRVVGPNVGDASTIKMLRSVMVKGIEALSAECILAARRAGVQDAVLASLQASDPALAWPVRMSYNLERAMVHGARRAAEMREVAATLRALGMPDRMALAAADWQDQIAALHLAGGADDLNDRADRILRGLSCGDIASGDTAGGDIA